MNSCLKLKSRLPDESKVVQRTHDILGSRCSLPMHHDLPEVRMQMDLFQLHFDSALWVWTSIVLQQLFQSLGFILLSQTFNISTIFIPLIPYCFVSRYDINFIHLNPWFVHISAKNWKNSMYEYHFNLILRFSTIYDLIQSWWKKWEILVKFLQLLLLFKLCKYVITHVNYLNLLDILSGSDNPVVCNDWSSSWFHQLFPIFPMNND